MTKEESIKHIDELIAKKKNNIADRDLVDYVELLFIRSTLIAENVAVAVKESFEQFTANYNAKFDAITDELKSLRKDLGYKNGN